jgi:hypothetical protein
VKVTARHTILILGVYGVDLKYVVLGCFFLFIFYTVVFGASASNMVAGSGFC